MSSKYYEDTFYDVSHLSLEDKEQLCRDGKEKCYEWWVDELVTTQRQRIEMEFDEMVKKLYNKGFHHFVFIHRRGYEDWKDPECLWSKHNWCLEIGFVSDMYYLWIYIKAEEIPYFVEKYNLNKTL